jgi:hypothetical protein
VSGTSLKAHAIRIPDVDGPDASTKDQYADAPVQPAAPADPSGEGLANTDYDPPVNTTPAADLHAQLSSTDPEKNAAVLDLAQKSGHPPAFVEKNLPAMKQASSAPGPDFFSVMRERYPDSDAWASKPENMAVGHDDLLNVVDHERLIQAAGALWGHPADAFMSGLENSTGGLIARGKVADHELGPDHTLVEGLAQQAGGLLGDAPLMFLGGMLGRGAGTVAGGVAGGTAASVIPGLGTIAGIIGGGELGGEAGQSAGAFALPAMVRTALLKKYQSGDVKGAEATWNDILSAIKDGASDPDVWKAGAKQGGIGALTGLAGFGAKFLGANTATKLLAETGVMTGAGAAADGKAPSLQDFAENLITVGGMHAITGLPAYISDQHQASLAKNFYLSLGDTAEASKLRQRLPDSYRARVEQLTKDGPVEHVYIPVSAAETYFQGKGLDPSQVFEKMGAGDSYTEAKATGGDVKIPLFEWTTRLEGGDYRALAGDVKFNPEALTENEAKQLKADKAEQFQKILDARAKASEEAEKVRSAGGEYTPELPALFTENYHKLRDAGMNDMEARHNAIVHDQFWSNMGNLFGMSGDTFAREYELSVSRGEAPAVGEGLAAQNQAGAVLNQSQFKLPEASPEGKAFPAEVPIARPAEGAPKFNIEDGQTKEARKSIRDAFRSFEKENLRGTYENAHTGWQIEVSKRGIGHAIDTTKMIPRELAALTALPDALRNAVHVSSEANTDQASAADIKAVHTLYAPIDIDGSGHLARITVKETKEGKKYYDQLTVESKRPPTQDHAGDESSTVVSGAQKLSIADLEREISVAKQRFTAFQPGDGSPRAQIRIAGKNFDISLLKDANKSSFIHETGHMFLEVMKSLSGRDDAPEQLKKDFQTIRDWMGLKDGEDIQTTHHEMFARAFEAYMMEGKAPSEALERTFGIFSKWLTKIYTTLTNLHVELSPDIRGVMDRMLASEEEVRRAAALSGYEMRDLPELPEEVRGKIMSLQSRARDQAEATLLKAQMKEVSAEHREALEVERQRLDAVARPEVEKLPIFQAIQDLRFDGEKTHGPYDLAERGLRGELTPREAAHFEVVAETHGFASAQDLAEQVQDAKDSNLFEREVRSRVNEGLKAHADLKDTALIREKALEAIHTNRTAELLALEREALGRLVTDATQKGAENKKRAAEAKIEAAAAKDAAKSFLEGKPAKEAGNYRTFIAQERRAAERAARALANKDYEAAEKAKQEQLLNHALAAEALKNKTEVQKTVQKLTKLARQDHLGKMPYAFARQVDSVLSRFGFQERKPEDVTTLSAIAKDMLAKGEDPVEIVNATGLKQDAQGRFVPESLSEFVTRVNDTYIPLSLPETVVSGTEKSFRELTLQELRQVRDAAQAVAAIGKAFDKFLELDRKLSVKEAARVFRASVEQEYGTPYAESLLPGSSRGSKFEDLVHSISNVPAAFDRALDTISTTMRKLDGLKDGPAQENISRPLQAASDRKILRTHETIKELEALIAKHYDQKEFGGYREERIQTGTRADGSPEYFTKEQILSMALNWGNEGNKQRLMDGFGFSEAKMQELFKHLGKKDWDFVQDTWDHLQKYWPEIVKLEMDVNGFEPKGVEPSEFMNEHGNYRGGYYPIAYDFEKSTEAYKNAEQSSALYKQYSTARAMTDQGHTEARASNVSRALRLSLEVLRDHHENVIHDLEFRRAVIDVSRFLMQKDTKGAIVNALGVKGYSGIMDWLKSAASPPAEPLSFGEQAARWFRFRTTMFMMAYNFKSLPRIGIENIANLSSELGVMGAGRAMWNYALGYKSIHELVVEKSPFMMERATHLDRDQANMTEALRGEKPNLFRKYAFAVHALADQHVSFPLWHDVYTREIGSGTDEKLAVTRADEAVRRTFMSGAETNQAWAMRGSEKSKFVTVAFGYQSMMWNRFSEQKFAAGKAIEAGDYDKAARIMAHATIYTFAAPAIITALAREFVRNPTQQGNNDDWKKRAAAAALEDGTPLKFVPILREVPTYMSKMAESGHSNFQVSPFESALETLLKPYGELAHSAITGKPLSDKFAEHTMNSISFTTGVPKSTNDLIFNFIDWQRSHGQATWQDFIASRRTKK